MVLNVFVKYLLSQKSGLNLNDGVHLNKLIEKIEEQEHEHIGLNTMKRLMGQIKDELGRDVGGDTSRQLQLRPWWFVGFVFST